MRPHRAQSALLGVAVRSVVVCSEALDRQLQLFVWHARLEEEAPRTLYHTTVRSLDCAIRFRAMWVRDVVSDTELATHGMKLGVAIAVPAPYCL